MMRAFRAASLFASPIRRCIPAIGASYALRGEDGPLWEDRGDSSVSVLLQGRAAGSRPMSSVSWPAVSLAARSACRPPAAVYSHSSPRGVSSTSHLNSKTSRNYSPPSLTPTQSAPPLTVGAFTSEARARDLQGLFHDKAKLVTFPPLFNVGGQPAMSVPLGWNDDGLPVGVHFATALHGDRSLLALAGQLERARPWVPGVQPLFVSR